MTEQRNWPYRPLREHAHTLSQTARDLLGLAEGKGTEPSLARLPDESNTFTSPGSNRKKPGDEDWDFDKWNHPYMMRSPAQAREKEKQSEQETGGRWFDEPYYSSPLWRPEVPNPEKDGDYITRLRARRPWTMSPKVAKKE